MSAPPVHQQKHVARIMLACIGALEQGLRICEQVLADNTRTGEQGKKRTSSWKLGQERAATRLALLSIMDVEVFIYDIILEV